MHTNYSEKSRHEPESVLSDFSEMFNELLYKYKIIIGEDHNNLAEPEL